MSHVIAVTSFSDHTWHLNSVYDHRFIPTPIQTVQTCNPIYVILINLTTSRVLGVAEIYRKLYPKKINMYDFRNLNRFVYAVKRRIDRVNMNPLEEKIMQFLEIFLMYGKDHYKRLSGISVIQQDKLRNVRLPLSNISIHQFIKRMFKGEPVFPYPSRKDARCKERNDD